MKAKLGVTMLLGLVCVGAVAASTEAASSRPSAGEWSGKIAGVRPKAMLTFDVTASGNKREVTLVSSDNFAAPCAGRPQTSIEVPNAAVGKAGTFKSRTVEHNGFGDESWTLSGKFKGGRASGKVAIVLAVSPTKRCDFTVKWSASLQPAGRVKDGALYRGTETNFPDDTVKFTVSPNGKDLMTVSWVQPPVSNCPGVSAIQVVISGANVPVHGDKFSYTKHSGHISNGAGTETTDTITGQFLAGDKASGTVTTSADISGIGTACQGNNTWSATT